MSGVLYLSYTGMLEPLGQSQVLAYLERLAAARPIHLVSFETAENWAKADELARLRQRMQTAGITWHPLRYHKRPSAAATAYDIAQGIAVGVRLVRRHKLSIIHARSYVPSVMALAIKRMTGARYLFDMRGFWADERVDGGLWARKSRLFRIAKDLERRFLLSADAVVSLTNAAKEEISGFPYLAGRVPPITVIPTCADLERFTPEGRVEGKPFTLGYVGGAGTWYLFDEALAVFTAVKRRVPIARLLVVNRGEHEFIRQRIANANVSFNDVDVQAANHGEVPGLMARMDAGLVLIKPVYSKTASAPTKLAEFLGCGVPCVANSGVGDMGPIVGDNRVGVVMDAFSPNACDAAAACLLALVEEEGLAARCVAVARQHFSLADGAKKYDEIYGMLTSMPRS